jgi:hypothetical protein
MIRPALLVLAALALLAGMATASAAPPHQNFVAPLSGGEEVPPVDTNARGQTLFRLNADETAIDFKLIVANLKDTTQAHIHCGAAGVNGPVVAFLFGLVEDGVTTNGILSQGTVTPADVIPRPDSAACPGGVADFDDLVEKMRSGEAYVNVHTVAHPPGEIRGQIRAVGPR